MKKIEKGGEGEIFPLTISNLLSEKLPYDIITYVIVPFLFSTCIKCSTLVIQEQSKDGKCPDCYLISVCFECDFRGMVEDFRVYMNYPPIWYCKNCEPPLIISGRKDCHYGVCNCAKRLSDPHEIDWLESRAKVYKESARRFEEAMKHKIKQGILATPIIYLAGKAIYSNLLGKRKR